MHRSAAFFQAVLQMSMKSVMPPATVTGGSPSQLAEFAGAQTVRGRRCLLARSSANRVRCRATVCLSITSCRPPECIHLTEWHTELECLCQGSWASQAGS